MTRVQFVSEWINNKNQKIKVYQVDKSAKQFELVGPGNLSSHFFGNYTQLIKKLKTDGYKSRSFHESETIDNFLDKIVLENALKPGQKKAIPKNIDVKLSPAALAALNGDPKTSEERKKNELELKKHAEEYKKLNALLNKMRKKEQILKNKQKTFGVTLTPHEAKYFSIIEKECSQFLVEMKKAKKLLYRGTNNAADVFYGKPHIKRRPTDTSPLIQLKVDKLLTAAGFKALRSNSIFASSSYGQAEEYGDVYIIFPKNGYSFTWSSKHYDWIPNLNSLNDFQIDWSTINNYVINYFQDLLVDLDDVFDTYSKPDKKLLVKKIKNYPNYKSIITTLNKVGGTIQNFDDDDDDLGEKDIFSLAKIFELLFIMQRKLNFQWPGLKTTYVNQMHKVIEVSEHISKKSKNLKTLATNFITKNGLKNTDMVTALKSGHEIYINGEYIALNCDVFKKSVHKFFLKI